MATEPRYEHHSRQAGPADHTPGMPADFQGRVCGLYLRHRHCRLRFHTGTNIHHKYPRSEAPHVAHPSEKFPSRSGKDSPQAERHPDDRHGRPARHAVVRAHGHLSSSRSARWSATIPRAVARTRLASNARSARNRSLASPSCIVAVPRRSWACPESKRKSIKLPSASAKAMILVVTPPRERPKARLCVPLLHPAHVGGPWRCGRRSWRIQSRHLQRIL